MVLAPVSLHCAQAVGLDRLLLRATPGSEVLRLGDCLLKWQSKRAKAVDAALALSVACGEGGMKLRRVLETVLYASDLDAAERFYSELLGLEVVSRRPGLFVFLRIGEAMLLIFDPEAAARGRDVPAHGAHGPGHVCFAVPEAELGSWKERLTAAGVAIEHIHHWPRGGWSFYVRDPAGNSVEFATPRIWGLPDLPQA